MTRHRIEAALINYHRELWDDIPPGKQARLLNLMEQQVQPDATAKDIGLLIADTLNAYLEGATWERHTRAAKTYAAVNIAILMLLPDPASPFFLEERSDLTVALLAATKLLSGLNAEEFKIIATHIAEEELASGCTN